MSEVAYRTVVADPPWPYEQADVRGSRTPKLDGAPSLGVGSRERYGAMSLEQILGLRPPAARDAHLWLWTTNAFMAEAHDVARAWGFKPKTIATWGKVKADGTPSMKTGYYLRGATEHCLLAVRGSLPLQTDRAIPTLWLWPRLAHSVKPDAFYDLVEECSPGPRLEMFARRNRLGDWATWGNEALGQAEVTPA